MGLWLAVIVTNLFRTTADSLPSYQCVCPGKYPNAPRNPFVLLHKACRQGSETRRVLVRVLAPFLLVNTHAPFRVVKLSGLDASARHLSKLPSLLTFAVGIEWIARYSPGPPHSLTKSLEDNTSNNGRAFRTMLSYTAGSLSFDICLSLFLM